MLHLHQAQQPRLAMEADVESDTKTLKHTEDAAADRAKHGDSSSDVVGGPTSSTSFGKVAEPPALPICRDGALVDEGVIAPKSFLLPGKMRMLTSAGDLLLVGTASTTLRTICPLPSLSSSICETKETGKYSSATDCQLNFNQLAPPPWKKVIHTKLGQGLVFDSGGCSGRLLGCPFLGGRRALLRRGSFEMLRWYLRLEFFFVERRMSFSKRRTSSLIPCTLLR